MDYFLHEASSAITGLVNLSLNDWNLRLIVENPQQNNPTDISDGVMMIC